MANWFVLVNGVTVGPLSSRVLSQLAESGSIGPESRVRLEASGTWSPARKVRGLAFGRSSAAVEDGGVGRPSGAVPASPPGADTVSAVRQPPPAPAPAPPVAEFDAWPDPGSAAPAHDAESTSAGLVPVPAAGPPSGGGSIAARLGAMPRPQRLLVIGGSLAALLFGGVLVAAIVGAALNRDRPTRSASSGESATSGGAAGSADEARGDASAKPAGSLTGRSGDLEFTLRSYDFRDSLVSSLPGTPLEYVESIKPSGHFLVLGIDVKNLGEGPESVDAGAMFSLRDAQGREFEVSQEGREALGIQGREVLLLKSINPRSSVRAIVPFDVPAKEAFELVAKSGVFSSETVMNIDLLMAEDRAKEEVRLARVAERAKQRAEAMVPGKVLASYKVSAAVPQGSGKRVDVAELRKSGQFIDPRSGPQMTWPTVDGAGTVEILEGGVQLMGFQQPADIPEYIKYNRFFPFITARNRESSKPGPNAFRPAYAGGIMVPDGMDAPPTADMQIENPVEVTLKDPEAMEAMSGNGPCVKVTFASSEELAAFMAAVRQAYEDWAARFPRAAKDEKFGTEGNDWADSIGDRKP